MVVEKTERAPRPRRRRRGRPPVVRDFYGSALDAAHQTTLKYASNVEGLDKEIALLRMKLRDALQDGPESFQLMIRGMDLLVKLVSARYRLSKKAEDDLGSHIAALLRGFSEQFYLEAPDGA